MSQFITAGKILKTIEKNTHGIEFPEIDYEGVAKDILSMIYSKSNSIIESAKNRAEYLYYRDTVLELPCRVGDTVWYIKERRFAKTIESLKVNSIEIYDRNLVRIKGYDDRNSGKERLIILYEYEVFATKELAELDLNFHKGLDQISDTEALTREKQIYMAYNSYRVKREKLEKEFRAKKKIGKYQ